MKREETCVWKSSHCHHQGGYHHGLGLRADLTTSVVSTPWQNLIPLTVDSSVSVVSSLVMKRDAILSLLHLRYLRLGTWSSCKVRVSPTRGEVRWSSSEVMVRKGRGFSTDAASMLLRRVVIGFVSTRVEGRMRVGGGSTVKAWDTVVRSSGLPVDWLHTVLELVRRLELPLADESPDDRDTSDRSGNGDDDGQCRSRRRARAAGGRDVGGGTWIRGSDRHELRLLALRWGAGDGRQRVVILWGGGGGSG